MAEVWMIIGPLVLLFALGSAVYYYLKYLHAPEPKRRPSTLMYVVGLIALGVFAYLIGAVIGVSAACASASAGNLCGLVGIFGIGPLLSGVAIFAFAHSWFKYARQAP